VTQRMTAEARRAEILRVTRAHIAAHGPGGLSLRAVARWCGMSAPGILHHFTGLRELIEAVLTERDAEEMAGVREILVRDGAAPSLRGLADALVLYLAEHPVETRNFDAMEAEAAADPEHPAHDYFLRQVERPLPIAVELARREYRDPIAVVSVLSIVADGFRHRWLRADGIPDYWAEWSELRTTVFRMLEPWLLTPEA
jgi:AcrR family transcriptional regulator